MRVDVKRSRYHEAPSAVEEFNKTELRSLRLLLRRLRFLETQVRQSGGLAEDIGSGSAAFAEWEADALEWILTDIGFLDEPVKPKRGKRK